MSWVSQEKKKKKGWENQIVFPEVRCGDFIGFIFLVLFVWENLLRDV